MATSEEYVEIIDDATGETFRLKTTSLVCDVRDVFLSNRRNQMMSALWKDLTESQQQDEITAADQLAKDIVRKIVEVVSVGNNDVIHALLGQFAIKDGKVKITAEGLADDAALLALNRVGKKALKIIVADHEQFDQERDEILPDPDQPALPMDAEPMSDDDIDDVGESMDEDIDAIEEPDNLHSEDEQPEQPPAVLGQQAGLAGNGPDENPFDGGTKDHLAWAKGYDEAIAEIKELRNAGMKAATDGKDRSSCTWKAGTDGERFWLEGFDSYAPDIAEPSDSYSDGKSHAKSGGARDDNPFGDDEPTKQRFWYDGFDSFDPEEA